MAAPRQRAPRQRAQGLPSRAGFRTEHTVVKTSLSSILLNQHQRSGNHSYEFALKLQQASLYVGRLCRLASFVVHTDVDTRLWLRQPAIRLNQDYFSRLFTAMRGQQHAEWPAIGDTIEQFVPGGLNGLNDWVSPPFPGPWHQILSAKSVEMATNLKNHVRKHARTAVKMALNNEARVAVFRERVLENRPQPRISRQHIKEFKRRLSEEANYHPEIAQRIHGWQERVDHILGAAAVAEDEPDQEHDDAGIQSNDLWELLHVIHEILCRAQELEASVGSTELRSKRIALVPHGRVDHVHFALDTRAMSGFLKKANPDERRALPVLAQVEDPWSYLFDMSKVRALRSPSGDRHFGVTHPDHFYFAARITTDGCGASVHFERQLPIVPRADTPRVQGPGLYPQDAILTPHQASNTGAIDGSLFLADVAKHARDKTFVRSATRTSIVASNATLPFCTCAAPIRS